MFCKVALVQENVAECPGVAGPDHLRGRILLCLQHLHELSQQSGNNIFADFLKFSFY
jgi:hypothetical protein